MSDLVERYRRQIEVALKYANDEKPAHDRILPSVFELQVGHLRDIGNELAAELSRLSALVAWQPTHRHVKTGGEYALIGIGTMQAAKWIDPIPPHGLGHPRVDMREVAIYRGADGKLWARPSEEFDDGRFEALPAPPVSQLKDTTNADK